MRWLGWRAAWFHTNACNASNTRIPSNTQTRSAIRFITGTPLLHMDRSSAVLEEPSLTGFLVNSESTCLAAVQAMTGLHYSTIPCRQLVHRLTTYNSRTRAARRPAAKTQIEVISR